MGRTENRGRYDRSKLRYPSDLTTRNGTDRSADPSAKRGGNKRTVNERDVVDGVMHILSTAVMGCTAEGSTATQHGQRLSAPLGR